MIYQSDCEASHSEARHRCQFYPIDELHVLLSLSGSEGDFEVKMIHEFFRNVPAGREA
jgi:hypothetical protein